MNRTVVLAIGLVSFGVNTVWTQQGPPDSSYPQQDGSNAGAPTQDSPMLASDLSSQAPNPNDYSTAFSNPSTSPAPAATEQQAEPVKPVAVEDGISTVDLDGGNWLLKRKALEKVVDTIEMINKVYTSIVDARVGFVESRNKADKAYDQFILANGFSVGQLRSVLDGLIESLRKERERQGALTDEEREALQLTNHQIVLVEQVQKDLEALAKLDESLDQVISQLDEEATKAHGYQVGAWENFQKIKMILSDQKAEDLALQTDGLYANIQDVYRYISRDLKTYFNQAVAKLNDTMTTVQSSIDTLKKSELDLANEVKRLEGNEAHESTEHAPAKKALPVERPWYKKLAVIWEYPAQKIADMIDWFKAFLG